MTTQHPAGRRPARSIRRLAAATALASGLLVGLVPGVPVPTAAAVDLDARYVPLTPYRICDTRPDSVDTVEENQCNDEGDGQKFQANQARNVDVTVDVDGVDLVDEVPDDADAVVLNVTATNPTASGYLTIWPSGADQPLASNINLVPGQTVPNLVTVRVGDDGNVRVYNFAGTTDVIIDVQGYFADSGVDPGDGEFESTAPTRICDTRAVAANVAANPCNNNGSGTGILGPGGTRAVQVAGGDLVPLGASAVVVNIAVTGTTANGHLRVHPSDDPLPLASSLNWVAGQTIANRVVVPLSEAGQFTVFNSAGNTNVVIDVNGFYSATDDEALYTPLVPARVCDTRLSSSGSVVENNQCNNDGATAGTLSGGETISVDIGGEGGVPEGAYAVVLNATVTHTTAASFLSILPEVPDPVTTSDLNWASGRTVANQVIVQLNDDDEIEVFNFAGDADVILDVQGYYLAD